jgi:hypothetical protein
VEAQDVERHVPALSRGNVGGDRSADTRRDAVDRPARADGALERTPAGLEAFPELRIALELDTHLTPRSGDELLDADGAAPDSKHRLHASGNPLTVRFRSRPSRPETNT